MSVGILKPKLSIQNDGTEKYEKEKENKHKKKKKKKNTKLCDQLSGAKHKRNNQKFGYFGKTHKKWMEGGGGRVWCTNIEWSS